MTFSSTFRLKGPQKSRNEENYQTTKRQTLDTKPMIKFKGSMKTDNTCRIGRTVQ